MLSFLFRLIHDFHAGHGFNPNTLYINTFHYRNLRESVPGLTADADLARFLDVDIILSEESIHPHVAWLIPESRQRAGGRSGG